MATRARASGAVAYRLAYESVHTHARLPRVGKPAAERRAAEPIPSPRCRATEHADPAGDRPVHRACRVGDRC